MELLFLEAAFHNCIIQAMTSFSYNQSHRLRGAEDKGEIDGGGDRSLQALL